MAQATCRVTPALDGAIEDAAQEAGLFKSDVLRRALVYYIKRNPDELRALQERSVSGVRSVNPRETEGRPDSISSGTYDPSGGL